MLIGTLPTTLLQIFFKKILDYQDIVKNSIDPDDKFIWNSCTKRLKIIDRGVLTTRCYHGDDNRGTCGRGLHKDCCKDSYHQASDGSRHRVLKNFTLSEHFTGSLAYRIQTQKVIRQSWTSKQIIYKATFFWSMKNPSLILGASVFF